MNTVLYNAAFVKAQKIIFFCELKNPNDKECNFKIGTMKMDKKQADTFSETILIASAPREKL